MEEEMKPNKPNKWIVVHPKTGERLCKDKRWRTLAFFGTFPTCVKIYKTRGYAKRIANQYSVDGETKIISIRNGR